MKVKILNEFRDVNKFSRLYKVGEEVEFEENRANDLIHRGLVEPAAKLNIQEGEGTDPTPPVKRGRKPSKSVE